MAVIATQSNYSMGQHRGVYSSSSFDTYRTDVKVLSDGPYFAIKNSEKASCTACDAVTLDNSTPSLMTAALVSSHDDSIPRIIMIVCKNT